MKFSTWTNTMVLSSLILREMVRLKIKQVQNQGRSQNVSKMIVKTVTYQVSIQKVVNKVINMLEKASLKMSYCICLEDKKVIQQNIIQEYLTSKKVKVKIIQINQLLQKVKAI